MATNSRDHAKLICDLGELAAIITDASDLDAMLQKIVDTVAPHMQADVCSVYLFDEAHQELVLRATRGLLPDSVGRVRLRPGEGLTGLAFAERRPICEADAPSNPSYRFFPGIGEEQYRSFVAVPILRGRRPIGAMTLESRLTGHFSAEDVQVFRAITMQLATTIEMARLLLTLETPSAGSPGADMPELRLVHGQVGAEGCAVGETVIIRQPSLAEIRALMGSSTLKMADFRRAVADTEKQLEHLEKLAGERLSDITAVIFSAQLLMLRDQSWLGAMEEQIAAGAPPAEGVYRVILEYVQRFERMDNAYMREKRYDVMDVGRRLLANLSGHRDTQSGREGRIAIAAELLPSEVLKLGLEKVGGIVLLSGGITSHVAVLARSLDLPLIFADEPRLLDLAEGTRVVLDARQGNLYIAPSEEVEQRFREQEEARRSAFEQADEMRPQSFTADGTRVRLLANINLIADVEVARSYRAEGIGLYRTEFPFMIRNDFPSEEEQLQIYRRLMEGMPGCEITFRTLDVGGDKMLSYFDYGAEANPFLGLRSIRFSLRHREVFLQQVRAILRAAHDTEVRIMFPMISSPDELAAAADAVDECRATLKRDGLPGCQRVQLGMMIEVPSVLEMMDELSRRADFFSIGTNDFVQYMLAVDRTNVHVADLYVPHHPAVLRGLHRAVSAALRNERDVSVCGDMAHDPRFVRFLLGIGVRKFSMSSRYLPRVQKAIALTHLDQARAFAQQLLAQSTVSGTTRLLDQAGPDGECAPEAGSPKSAATL
ncbi:MAG: phosphoenolpyruvate--protein phosphotransferase [Polyangia bacterium]|jgi:phosphotransferase system enzyme I (PtsP)